MIFRIHGKNRYYENGTTQIMWKISMRHFIGFSLIVFIGLLFSLFSCKKECIYKTADEILSEYFSDPEIFVRNYKNVTVCIEGDVGFATQAKENPGDKYYMIFDSNTFNPKQLSGNFVSCNMQSKSLGFAQDARGKHIKVECTFSKIYKDESGINLCFRNGCTVDEFGQKN